MDHCDRGGQPRGTAPAKPSFRPPNTKRAARAAAPAHTPDRFLREVLGGRLWHPACQAAANGELSDQIPLHFASVDEYIATFDPLVLEEAREGVKADWAEGCAGGRAWAVQVCGVEEMAGGWMAVRVRAHERHEAMRMACQPNTVAVLSLGRPPQRGAVEWAQAEPPAEDDGAGAPRAAKRARADAGGGGGAEGAEPEAPAAAGIVAGLAVRSRSEEVVLKLHPGCAHHGASGEAPCGAVVAALRQRPRRWWLVAASMLVSSEREFDAVHNMRSIDPDLLRHILRPRLLQEIGAFYKDDDVRRRMWPEQARSPAFIDHLKRQYDYKQLEAIEMAACHLGAPDVAPAAAPGVLPTLPFVLIQGPPGTGKTHTVRGVLNVWHLVAFQRYYDSLVQKALPAGAANAALLCPRPAAPAPAPAPAIPTLNSAGSNLLEVLSAGIATGGAGGRLGTAAAADKPRILVCAPSNAACDELMARVMSAGFCDGNGRTYRPNVVRVGGDSAAVSPAVRERLLPRLVERYGAMPQPEWQQRCADAVARLQRAAGEVSVLEMSVARAEGAQQATKMAARLVEVVQLAQKLRRELERLEAARPLVWGRRGEGGALAGGAWAGRAESELEALLLEEAEMVFATLSASQRRGFRAVAQRVPFHTVLIDEAGQASEVAALQPLGFGARRVVLVGDPQQLPATVLSAAAKAAAMERSLFERLQAQGCPVVVLGVQYRMHPHIRAFPSRHFYADRLEDAPSVRAAPAEPYHAHPLMRPYLLFDVAAGREQRQGGGGGSLSNAAEAELAACLFLQLQGALRAAAAARPRQAPPLPPTSVAVITPYREQRKALREAFRAVCGPEAAAQVSIETVDSFQGRQMDVVMLSCVRAGAGGGLGFVNDVRRMNVAITRARRSLWVLGSVATLQGNTEWEALIEDAKARGLVVWDADAQTLFPDVAYFRKPQQQQQQQQPQQQGRHEPEEDVDPLLWRQQQEEVERPRIAIWQVYTLLAASAVCVARLRLRPGKQRLALAFFVVALNALVPLLFDGHTELITNLMTFINTTLNSFKVLAWALDRGALAQPLTARQFVGVFALPITPAEGVLPGEAGEEDPQAKRRRRRRGARLQESRSVADMASRVLAKMVSLGVVLAVLAAVPLPRLPSVALQAFSLYCSLSMGMDLSGALAAWLLDIEVTPHFDNPYASTSARDFWNKRWNLTVSNVMRSLIYEPIMEGRWVRRTGQPAAAAPFTRARRAAGVAAVFASSGAMHELMYWYAVGRFTRGLTWLKYFALWGAIVLAEGAARRAVHRGGAALPVWAQRIVFTTLFNVLMSCMWWPPAEEARLPQIANEHALAAWGATVAAVRGAAKMWALQEARD